VYWPCSVLHKFVRIRADYVFDFSIVNIALPNVPKCDEIYYNLGINCTGSQRACACMRTWDHSYKTDIVVTFLFLVKYERCKGREMQHAWGK
jgi:hypothetical protein